MPVACCGQMNVPFNNVATVSIPWGAPEADQFGQVPNVQVWYQQDGNYVLSDDNNQVIFTTTSIEVDLGGPGFTGIIKIF